jgi:hypothetical protein
MPKRKAFIRLLGPSIYSDSAITNLNYPIVVQAEICDILTHHAHVPGRVMRKMLGWGFWADSLIWFNPMYDGDGEVSWEEVEINPFTAWNNLKSSRDVGAMPATLDVIR